MKTKLKEANERNTTINKAKETENNVRKLPAIHDKLLQGLYVTKGFCAKVMADIIQHAIKSQAVQENLWNRYKKKQDREGVSKG